MDRDLWGLPATLKFCRVVWMASWRIRQEYFQECYLQFASIFSVSILLLFLPLEILPIANGKLPEVRENAHEQVTSVTKWPADTKLPELRKNARDQVPFSFGVASDWLRGWRECCRPITAPGKWNNFRAIKDCFRRSIKKFYLKTKTIVFSHITNNLFLLQHACGYEYTNKLHRMFTDISISSDLNSSFNDFLSNAEVSLGVTFTLFVLQVNSCHS